MLNSPLNQPQFGKLVIDKPSVRRFANAQVLQDLEALEEKYKAPLDYFEQLKLDIEVEFEKPSTEDFYQYTTRSKVTDRKLLVPDLTKLEKANLWFKNNILKLFTRTEYAVSDIFSSFGTGDFTKKETFSAENVLRKAFKNSTSHAKRAAEKLKLDINPEADIAKMLEDIKPNN